MELPGMIQEEPAAKSTPRQVECPTQTKIEAVNVLPPTDRSVANKPAAHPIYHQEEPPPKPKGCISRCRRRFEQQEPARSTMPLWMFQWKAQVASASCCALMLLLIGILMLTASSGVVEVIVSYKYPDTFKTFTVDKKMEGDVLMWYDLSNLYVNQKRYVENKDKDVIKAFLLGSNICKQAYRLKDVLFRRVHREERARAEFPQSSVPADLWSQRVLMSELEGKLKPCGLNSIAMFSDEYALHTEDGVQMTLDESDVALKRDEDIFGKNIDTVPGNGTVAFQIQGANSWLQRGAFYEHFKVWMRSPASTRFRQLWATIPGGLDVGSYNLTFPQNSAIWTAPSGWGVDEKRVVFSTSNTFGSKGASLTIGIICLCIAVFEVGMAIFFVVTHVLMIQRHKPPEYGKDEDR